MLIRVMVVLGLSVIALAILAYFVLVVPTGELGEARGWTVLQGTELKYRDAPNVQDPMFLSRPLGSNFMVLGLPTNDRKFPRVWIILDELTPTSSIYILPREQVFTVTCSYVIGLSVKTKIAP